VGKHAGLGVSVADAFASDRRNGNGGAKLGHGSGGIVSLRAE
jgi:hypothetical protein